MQFTDQVYQQYNKASSAQKSYVNIVLTLGLLILLVVLIYPAVQHILTLQQEITDGQKVLSKLQEKSDSLDKAEANYNAVQEDLNLLSEALPNGSDLKTYIQRPLESLSASHSLSLTGLQFSEVPISLPKEDEVMKDRTLTFSMVVSGNFVDFNKFVIDLEKFIRTTQVDTISLTSIQNGSVTATIKATTHYLGQATALKTEGSAAVSSGGVQ